MNELTEEFLGKFRDEYRELMMNNSTYYHEDFNKIHNSFEAWYILGRKTSFLDSKSKQEALKALEDIRTFSIDIGDADGLKNIEIVRNYIEGKE